jgi:hypothetical protein
MDAKVGLWVVVAGLALSTLTFAVIFVDPFLGVGFAGVRVSVGLLWLASIIVLVVGVVLLGVAILGSADRTTPPV